MSNKPSHLKTPKVHEYNLPITALEASRDALAYSITNIRRLTTASEMTTRALAEAEAAFSQTVSALQSLRIGIRVVVKP